MAISKSRISSPLEAGSSLLLATQLPPQLTGALEYVSSRLARKGLHLSLIVVRQDVKIPSLTSPSPSPLPSSPNVQSSPPHSTTTSPTRSLFSTAATNLTKALSKHSSRTSLKNEASSVVSKTSSPGSSLSGRTSSSSTHSRTHWPSLPSSPKDPNAIPPRSPPQSRCPSPVQSTDSSSSSSPSSSPSPSPEPGFEQQPNPYGITLMHASTLTGKATKILHHIISRAEKKFSIGSNWLQPSSTTPCPKTNDLIRRSLTQNNILFSSEGLTLLELDNIYTFKHHLHTYSLTLTQSSLTLAIDELHRLVLAQQGRRITKTYLMHAYEWLSISLAALVDINEAYKVAYGGKERRGGVEGADEERDRRSPALALKTSFSGIRTCAEGETSPGAEAKDEVAFGETAKGIELDGAGGDGGTGVEITKLDRGPHRRGPVTPNGVEDITPVTRGSWGLLMVGEGWNGPRVAAVQTC